MAIYDQNKDLGSTWTISDIHSVYTLGEDATITVGEQPGENYAIREDSTLSDNQLLIKGDIKVSLPFGTIGISAAGDDTLIKVFKSSEISGGGYGILANAVGGTIVNQGFISGNQYAIHASNAFEINNSGTLQGGSGMASGTGNVQMQNSGKIEVAINGIIVNDAGGSSIVNHETGEIDSLANGVATYGSGDVLLVNRGTIIGGQYGVYDGGGNLTVRNFGDISGFIELGAGNDSFDNRQGTTNGIIHGGLGDDTFMVSDANANITEDNGSGNDHVKSTVDFRLGGNFEDLTLLGGGDLTAKGNELDNDLFGNKGNNLMLGFAGADTIDGLGGNDVLTGGSGADVFVFNQGARHDVITDFKDGSDLLYLEAVFDLPDFVDLKKNHLQQVGDDLVITYGKDQLTIEDMKKSELSIDDFFA